MIEFKVSFDCLSPRTPKTRLTLIEDIAQNEKIETQRTGGLKTVGFG